MFPFACRVNKAILAVAAAAVLTGCGASRPVGRAEALYKSLGGPEFIGADGGADLNTVNRWFDAHPADGDKFTGPNGICNGYEPAGDNAQRERVVCAGAARLDLEKMSKGTPSA